MLRSTYCMAQVLSLTSLFNFVFTGEIASLSITRFHSSQPPSCHAMPATVSSLDRPAAPPSRSDQPSLAILPRPAPPLTQRQQPLAQTLAWRLPFRRARAKVNSPIMFVRNRQYCERKKWYIAHTVAEFWLALSNMTRFIEQRPCCIGGPRELVRLGLFATVGCSGEEQVLPLPLPPVVVKPPPSPPTPRLPSSVAVEDATETASKKDDLLKAISSLSERDCFGVFLRRLIFPSRPT